MDTHTSIYLVLIADGSMERFDDYYDGPFSSGESIRCFVEWLAFSIQRKDTTLRVLHEIHQISTITYSNSRSGPNLNKVQ